MQTTPDTKDHHVLITEAAARIDTAVALHMEIRHGNIDDSTGFPSSIVQELLEDVSRTLKAAAEQMLTDTTTAVQR